MSVGNSGICTYPYFALMLYFELIYLKMLAIVFTNVTNKRSISEDGSMYVIKTMGTIYIVSVMFSIK